jgi:hypothetical protein
MPAAMHHTKPSILPSRMRSAAGKKTGEAKERIASVAWTSPNQHIHRGRLLVLRPAIEADPTNTPNEATWSVPPCQEVRLAQGVHEAQAQPRDRQGQYQAEQRARKE